MQPNSQPTSVSKPILWLGYIISVLVVAAMVMSGVMKLMKPKEVIEGFEKLGWDEGLALGLAIVEIASALIYACPRTAVLGAILLTGYLGGAVATHVRIYDFKDMPAPIIIGVLVWGALWLRDVRLRALVPWRS